MSPSVGNRHHGSWDLQGKTAFVTGGSGGLGKAIAKQLVARGAHVTLFSRRVEPLQAAKREILQSCATEAQHFNVDAIAVDVSDAAQIEEVFRAQQRTADMLYCCAGGNHAENGYLADIEADALDRCMKNNYFSAAYAAQTLLKIWREQDTLGGSYLSSYPKVRQIVFVSSAAAFVCLPGSVAYSPAKSALRALADTLRMEVLRFNSPSSTYTVHCSFPADFLSSGFAEELKTKTTLNKRIQGLQRPVSEIEAKLPSADQVASHVIAGVDRGDFIICNDFSGSLLFTAMTGPSPRRGWGVTDALLSVVTTWFIWPFLRVRWDAMAREDGKFAGKQV